VSGDRHVSVTDTYVRNLTYRKTDIVSIRATSACPPWSECRYCTDYKPRSSSKKSYINTVFESYMIGNGVPTRPGASHPWRFDEFCTRPRRSDLTRATRSVHIDARWKPTASAVGGIRQTAIPNSTEIVKRSIPISNPVSQYIMTVNCC